MPKLTFLKQNRILEVRREIELKQLSQLDPTLPLKFGCLQGSCGTCAFKIKKGEQHLSPKTCQEKQTLERLNLSFHRLACQCALTGDLEIEV